MVEQSPFRILTVCTGNICRSPMTERLLQQGLDTQHPGVFSVASAGTGAMSGWPIDSRVAAQLDSLGVDPSAFVARSVTAEMLSSQDLVIALTRAHRSEILRLAPWLLQKTFTLRELGRLLPGVSRDESLPPQEQLRNALPRALRGRSMSSVEPADDDVVDPYGREEEQFRHMFGQVIPAVEAILAWTK
ncbi:arsenate reductase/protein-tyrosine-phosphatase family protein [Arthrobacter sp. TB 23]|uniref:arsenate reductase/protein-tyrosine-phosphatase family protein n=1 Tax=Arthrobacter sp. TB 23 TaxID=494419 RepID=UPI000474F8E5|nr:hypothetical protein [Arthrobacter sp. TB 23]